MTSPDRPSGRGGPDEAGPDALVGQVGRYAGHGFTIAAATVVFALAGDWLDGRLGTTPLFVLLGVFVGFGAGFYSMYRQLVLDGTDEDGTEGEHAGEDGG